MIFAENISHATIVLDKINAFLWGYPVLVLMLGGGIYLSVRLGFPQMHIFKLLRETIFSLFKGTRKTGDGISQLQGFSTALAATVGTGSVTGVACALHQGGAGAIFWMWVSAFFGMCLSYCENFLSVKFSRQEKISKKFSQKGRSVGAISYLRQIGSTGILAAGYAVFTILSSLGMGNMTQAGSVVSAANTGFHIPIPVCAVVLTIFCAVTVADSLRSARLCEKLMPACTLLFIAGSMCILIKNPLSTCDAFCEIIESAFSLKACAGGTLGGLITNVCIQGLKRGAFSNEAGLGSTCAVHSSCNIKDEQLQGKWAMTEVFIDTMVICTLSALVILVTKADFFTTADGNDTVLQAFSTGLGSAGKIFTSLCLMLFALCTLTGWFFIGEKTFCCLFPKGQFIYKLLYVFCTCIGAVSSSEFVWSLSDLFNGLMALPNITGVLILSTEISRPKFRRWHDG